MTGLDKLSLIFKLGVLNVLRVFWYRITVRFGLGSAFKSSSFTPVGKFFLQPSSAFSLAANGIETKDISLCYFGYIKLPMPANPPDWHYNPFSNVSSKKQHADWWTISDFGEEIGDVKIIWELSRFDWAVQLAQLAAQGDATALVKLNAWIEDWCKNNPPYKGINWKCGQEASIRVMHMAMVAFLLRQTKPVGANVASFLVVHLRRIEPTLSYAIAQDNNHGTSEAAALFIGGSILFAAGHAEGRRWQNIGRKWLEERANRLIGKSGSFSQYSLNYHRVMLDTLSMAEFWRRHFELPKFSSNFYGKAAAATLWLYGMIDSISGDGPNVGANDGARLLPLSDTDYRDFRPSVQLAMCIFLDAMAYPGDGPWNSQLQWLGITVPNNKAPSPTSMLMDDGGFAVLRVDNTFALLRYPRFRFRPSQADILHVDFWMNGRNLLRDAGTFSYNTDSEVLGYFSGTASHNTIQFDSRDQMPRVSRFLFSHWLTVSAPVCISRQAHHDSVTAGYSDRNRVSHTRTVSLGDKLTVIDEVAGFKEKAVLRWRLEPGEWTLEGHTLKKGNDTLKVHGSMKFSRFVLVAGWESRYYFAKEELPVLEIEFDQPGKLTTEYCWTP